MNPPNTPERPGTLPGTRYHRAMREIQPGGDDLSQPVFGLTGETLANRVRAAASAAAAGEALKWLG